MYKDIFVSLLAGLVCLACLTVPAQGVAARSTTRQLIIRLQDDGTRNAASVRPKAPLPGLTLPDGRQLTYVRSLDDGSMVVELPEAVSLEQANALVDRLVQDHVVQSAQVDKRLYPAFIPNDPRYNNMPSDPNFPVVQWNLFEDTAGIRMPAAWDQTTGSSSVVIAVLDTGILPHSDLDPTRILTASGYDFISDTVSANDGDGRDGDPTDPGDAVQVDDCGPGDPLMASPSSWHGLLVTGIIAATSDNSADIAGIDFNARILPVRVLGKCGGVVSDIADAIRWAAGLPVKGVSRNNPIPADIINLSLAGAGACTPAEQNAIDAAVGAGAVVVVAAGNDGQDVVNFSPANCNNVVTVGAISRAGKIASYTNRGIPVDLVAPGGGDGRSVPPGTPNPDDLVGLWNLGTTSAGAEALATTSGTSFTAAQVSAVASLMRAVNGSLGPASIKDILCKTARNFPDASCNGSLCGAGVLDASAALAGAADPASVAGNAGCGVVQSRSGGGGGGGCTIQATRRLDPLLPLWLLAGFVGLYRRSR